MIKGVKLSLQGDLFSRKEKRRQANKRFRDKHKKKKETSVKTEPTAVRPVGKIGVCEYCGEKIIGDRNEHYNRHKEDRITEGK